MELQIKHLAPYLPYKLKICYRILDLENGNPNTDNPNDRLKNCIMVMTGDRLDRNLLPETDRWYDKNSLFKPILKPLSDLFTTDKFSVSNLITHGYHHSFWGKENFSVNHIYYHDLLLLLEYHFDVFGLIDAGLAIDINTL